MQKRLSRRTMLAGAIAAAGLGPWSRRSEALAAGDLVFDNLSMKFQAINNPNGGVTIKHISKCSFNITAATFVTITEKIDDFSNIKITCGGDVTIGQKVDQHSSARVTAGGTIRVGQKIDQHSIVTLTSKAGSIVIGQKVDQHSQAFLNAPSGDVTIVEGVDQHSRVHWVGKTGNVPNLGNGSTVDHNLGAQEQNENTCC